MAITTNKFILNKGLSNEFIITIKQDNAVDPMVIDPTDTFEVKLYLLSTNEEVATIDMTDSANGKVEIENAAGGQIKITFYDALINTLKTERGDKVDGYYLLPLYRLAIDAATVNNGNFVAKIDKVYVEA